MNQFIVISKQGRHSFQFLFIFPHYIECLGIANAPYITLNHDKFYVDGQAVDYVILLIENDTTNVYHSKKDPMLA
jgi:hypothetical protein